MGLLDRFWRIQDSEDDTATTVQEAEWAVSFAQHPHYARLLKRIETEADRPITMMSNSMEMAGAIARINTYKEIRNNLRREVFEAAEFLRRHREEHNG